MVLKSFNHSTHTATYAFLLALIGMAPFHYHLRGKERAPDCVGDRQGSLLRGATKSLGQGETSEVELEGCLEILTAPALHRECLHRSNVALALQSMRQRLHLAWK
jgi:hypothetical protein